MGRLSLVLSVSLLAPSTARPAEPPVDPRPTNRLARETSPYLRQHAHNPVDWFPWCPEAFEKAKKEKKLVFLSIGYSACHWCHVMERESFSDAEVARLLNASFVCIKVDREERPDVDQIYMAALHLFGQPGGWPLSMFLTSEGKPIAGGTYWPPDDRSVNDEKVSGFKSVIRLILELQRDSAKEVAEQSEQVAKAVARSLSRTGRPMGLEPRRFLVNAAVDALKGEFDPEFGGFGNAQRAFKGPKFPMPPYLELLSQQARRQESAELLGMLTKTLDGMATRGIYDQLGGGFHRYSTERTWTVPHFEKMLNDNAQLAKVYARAFAQAKNPLYRRIVDETLEFVHRELAAPGGAFYSALDADSGGVEGRFYLWTTADLKAALPDEGDRTLAREAFGIGSGQESAGKEYVLIRARDEAATDGRVADVRRKLLAARAKRSRPFLDTKVLTAWNGQMIAGYAVAGQLLDAPKYLDAAAGAADFVLRNLRAPDGRLLRTYAAAPDGAAKASLTAYLDDYAFLTDGLLELHDATSADRWLTEAKALTDQMIRHYGDAEGGAFFYTADDHEKLFARAKDTHDGAQPSGNSVAVRNLLRLAAKTGEARYRDLAGRALRAFATEMEQNPTGMTTMVAALDQYLAGAPAQPPAGRPAPGQPVGGPKRSDAVLKVAAAAEKPTADGKQTVKVTLTIDKGWHVYANPVGNADLDSAQTTVTVGGKVKPKGVAVDYPKGQVVKDMLVGDYKVYEKTVEIKATVERAAGDTGPLEVTVKLQACNDKTCLLPATVKLTVP